MCGIIGKVSDQPIDLTLFNKQRDAIGHRGPDAHKTKLLCDTHVALGHLRLAIIDLSELGDQPMTNEDGTVWLTFNGEIYNFPILKKELEEKGHVFRSTSDTETIIHGYEEWGVEGLLKRLNGMFAFAIWDENTQELVAARDRFGIKPFYYSQKAGTLTFASELKALVEDSAFERDISLDSIADFLVYRFIPSPKTIYKGAKKLPPAHYLRYNKRKNELSIRQYWSLSTSSVKKRQEEIDEEVAQSLKSSIQSHLLSDVPVGVFLSGGYDSSALVHFMSGQQARTTTYSIGFEDWPTSEHEDARLVANIYGTDHFEKILKPGLADNLALYVESYDEPLGGSSFMPTFELSEFASRKHKVVLGGDGGDEVFAGYKWYNRVLEYRNSARGRFARVVKPSDQLLQYYHTKMSWSGYNYSNVASLLVDPIEVKDTTWLYKELDRPDLSDLKRMQVIDLHTFLPEVINTKVDRASMAHSLEVRVPFLDHELVEKVLSFDEKYYFEKGVTKKLLRNIIAPHFPDQILNKTKQGFGAPVKLDESLRELTQSNLVKNGLINKESVDEMISLNNKAKLWPLQILSHWFDRWIF